MTSVNCHSRAQREAETHNRRGQGHTVREPGYRLRSGEERGKVKQMGLRVEKLKGLAEAATVIPETLFPLKKHWHDNISLMWGKIVHYYPCIQNTLKLSTTKHFKITLV